MRFNFTKRFSTNEDGGLSIEAVLAIPLLVWALTATIVFYDAFKTPHISQKATYTIADMLSHEEAECVRSVRHARWRLGMVRGSLRRRLLL